MRTLPPPRNDVTVISLVFIGFGLVVLSQCFDYSRDFFSLFGLAFDIIGAMVLVIPDLPMIEKHFQSGKLKTGLDRLRSGWFPILTASEQVKEAPEDRKHLFTDEGFEEVRSVFKEWEESREKDIKVWERAYQFMPTELDPSKKSQTIFIDVLIDPDNPHPSIQKLDLPIRVEDKIEQLEGRFRRCGIILLIFGFLVQGGAIVVG